MHISTTGRRVILLCTKTNKDDTRPAAKIIQKSMAGEKFFYKKVCFNFFLEQQLCIIFGEQKYWHNKSEREKIG